MTARPPFLARIDTHRVTLMETEASCEIAPDPTRTFRPPIDDTDEVAFYLKYCGGIVAVALMTWAALDPLGLLKLIEGLL